MLEIRCKICNTEFKIYPGEIQKSKFCSKFCHYKYLKDKPRSKETKEKLRQANLGKKHSMKTKKRLSLYFIGKEKSPQHSENIRKAKLGNKNPNWKGGITFLRKAIRKLPEYYNWRKQIFERDSYTCIKCLRQGYLHSDHFPKSYNKLIEENNIKAPKDAIQCSAFWDISNGRTLCLDCHKKTINYGYREKKIYNKNRDKKGRFCKVRCKEVEVIEEVKSLF